MPTVHHTSCAPLPPAGLQDAQAVDQAVQVAMLALLHLELLVLLHAVGGPALGLLGTDAFGSPARIVHRPQC
jgi:hypothetical protein